MGPELNRLVLLEEYMDRTTIAADFQRQFLCLRVNIHAAHARIAHPWKELHLHALGCLLH